MLDKNARQWQSLDMLPVMIDNVQQAIHASKNAQERLKYHQPDLMPNDLWSDQQCLVDHEIQIEQLLLIRQQVEFWRKNHYLTPVQKIEILHLENTIAECENLSQQVVFMLHDRLK